MIVCVFIINNIKHNRNQHYYQIKECNCIFNISHHIEYSLSFHWLHFGNLVIGNTVIVADLDVVLVEGDQLLRECYSHALVAHDLLVPLEVHLEEQLPFQLVQE